jgi:hypothetical protein
MCSLWTYLPHLLIPTPRSRHQACGYLRRSARDRRCVDSVPCSSGYRIVGLIVKGRSSGAVDLNRRDGQRRRHLHRHHQAFCGSRLQESFANIFLDRRKIIYIKYLLAGI